MYTNSTERPAVRELSEAVEQADRAASVLALERVDPRTVEDITEARKRLADAYRRERARPASPLAMSL